MMTETTDRVLHEIGSRFQGRLLFNVPLKTLTSWDVGGPADGVFLPDTEDSICECIRMMNHYDVPWFVLGSGTNILFSDRGFRGVVIILRKGFSTITRNGCEVIADAGASLHDLVNFCIQNGLSGVVELTGIPGSVGGAAFCNAGAFGIWFLDRVSAIDGIDEYGEKFSLSIITSSYRTGLHKTRKIYLRVTLNLEVGDAAALKKLASKIRTKRSNTQPLGEKSAGCTFKNPENTGAGRLIDMLRLKGFRMGGAVVSEKHANFIINSSNASALDIFNLMNHIRASVFEKYSVVLEPEVLILDEFAKIIPLDPLNGADDKSRKKGLS